MTDVKKTRDEIRRDEMIDQADRIIVSEKSPDDMYFEGGNRDGIGRDAPIAGDVRTLAANDNPDDLEGDDARV
ncbi:hypothetical protein [Alicyclobacillus dauci]|uniref:Uncharacterized protein n=1 Tax=Alicyclobacillus dauci TaxID=1475485 RepID=A0ABY6Z1E4_9BACL|nr:hypothetical protein [Alicyclobacillus dauci]WAH35795.1 hypothetical protein NZD86_16175 [Alicyclobacillus dauci]